MAWKSWVLKPADFWFYPGTKSHTLLRKQKLSLHVSTEHGNVEVYIREGEPRIGPLNLTNGRHKDAGLLMLLVKTANLSNIQAHLLVSAHLYMFEWEYSVVHQRVPKWSHEDTHTQKKGAWCLPVTFSLHLPICMVPAIQVSTSPLCDCFLI